MEVAMELKVALVQTDLYWENVTANLAALEEKLATLSVSPDVIVLPEMFTTGFTMNAVELAEPVNHTTSRWLSQMAAKTQALVIGSFVIKEEGKYFNRLFSYRPDGTFQFYNKRHLFRMGKENEVYTGGQSRLIIDWKGWKICPLVCYDLRFPVWSRITDTESYDVLIYVANWPAKRSHAWRSLLYARAIENQSYTIGVNRVGIDGNEVEYDGSSLAIDYQGRLIDDLQDQEMIQVVTLSKTDLERYRVAFPAYLDADGFSLGE
jgi:omega-amidase